MKIHPGRRNYCLRPHEGEGSLQSFIKVNKTISLSYMI